MSTPLSRRSTFAAAALLIATIAAPSAAQSSALGGGRALDRNLQSGAGRINPTAPQVDYRAQNEDVTGTLAGGRSFRGGVGYRASGDFSAPVGSDAIYGSLRYSAYSDPLLFNSPIRNDQFRTAEGMGVYQFRRDYSALPVYTGVGQVQGLVEQQIRLDRSNAAMISGNLYGSALSVSQLGLLDEAGRGPSVVSASPLQGIRAQPLADPLLQAGLSPYERSLALADLSRRSADAAIVGERFRDALSPSLADSIRADAMLAGSDDAVVRQVERRLLASSVDSLKAREILGTLREDLAAGRIRRSSEVAEFVESRLDPTARTHRLAASPDGTDRAYDQIVRRVVEQYSGREDHVVDAGGTAMAQVRAEMELLRRSLRGEDPARRSGVDLPGSLLEAPPEEARAREGSAAVPNGAAPLASAAPSRRDPERRDAPPSAPGERTLSIDDMALVLRHGRVVDSLSEDDLTRLGELLAEGQSLLAAGDFFRAERRFEGALRLQPEHPLASIGLAHSQTGAGLYLSAGLTLRRLFTEHPEMIDARYAPALLPPRERIDAVAEALRRRIEQGRDLAGYGLLLAYLGHQTGDRDLLREGLRTIDGSGDERIEPLAQLLYRVWLPQEPEAAP